eukprot:jgi/Botrbrau1/17262/Bobra.0015s0021.1
MTSSGSPATPAARPPSPSPHSHQVEVSPPQGQLAAPSSVFRIPTPGISHDRNLPYGSPGASPSPSTSGATGQPLPGVSPLSSSPNQVSSLVTGRGFPTAPPVHPSPAADPVQERRVVPSSPIFSVPPGILGQAPKQVEVSPRQGQLVAPLLPQDTPPHCPSGVPAMTPGLMFSLLCPPKTRAPCGPARVLFASLQPGISNDGSPPPSNPGVSEAPQPQHLQKGHGNANQQSCRVTKCAWGKGGVSSGYYSGYYARYYHGVMPGPHKLASHIGGGRHLPQSAFAYASSRVYSRSLPSMWRFLQRHCAPYH